MQLVKFLKDHGGYVAGSYQWYDEAMADAMAKNGLVEIYVKPEDKPMIEPETEKKEPAKKQVRRAPKDKMVRSAGKSK